MSAFEAVLSLLDAVLVFKCRCSSHIVMIGNSLLSDGEIVTEFDMVLSLFGAVWVIQCASLFRHL